MKVFPSTLRNTLVRTSDETQCHVPEPKHNSETASQCVTKHHDQQNQWNKQHQQFLQVRFSRRTYRTISNPSLYIILVTGHNESKLILMLRYFLGFTAFYLGIFDFTPLHPILPRYLEKVQGTTCKVTNSRKSTDTMGLSPGLVSSWRHSSNEAHQ